MAIDTQNKRSGNLKIAKYELTFEQKDILNKSNFRKIIYLIKKANEPLPPENSATLRVLIVIEVILGIYACYTVSEITLLNLISVSAVTIAGNIFSALTRKKPYSWIKIILAVAATSIFLNTLFSIINAATNRNVPSILAPLAALFMWTIAIHSFDVPARRDLTFSLSGSAGLVAIAAAQAIANSFSIIVMCWLIVGIICLNLLWRSQTSNKETAKHAFVNTLSAIIFAAMISFVIVLVLPPPQPLKSITFPSSIQNRVPVSNPGGLTQGGSNPTAPAKAGQPGGKVQVGGYLGFSGPLNTSLRGALSNQIVLRVRATEPGYWLGETFNTWNGQSWTQSPSNIERLTGTPSFYLPFKLLGEPPHLLYGAQQNTETFYVATPLPNLLFGTESPIEIYFPGSHLYLGPGRSIRSRDAMESGTIYTVISRDIRLNPTQLQNVMPSGTPYAFGLPNSELKTDLQLPKPYTRVRLLAEKIVKAAKAKSTYQIVTALESWMGSHMHYSLNIPPLPYHADSVDQFLFVTKTGFCEQISSALVVMLRSLKIPAREAVGYVAGSYDPITNLYQVKASDAHAWVQVWYGPNGGWQDTDPTTVVPYSTPSPGQIILRATANFAKNNIFLILSILVALIFVGTSYLFINKLIKFRRLSFGEKIILKFNKVGSKYDVIYKPNESFLRYMQRLKNIEQISSHPQLISNLDCIGNTFDNLEYNPSVTNDPEKSNFLKNQVLDDIGDLISSFHKLKL